MHDLDTNETRELIDTPDVPLVVHVWDERLQSPGENPCKHKNGNCSHLCLLSNSTAGFTCMFEILVEFCFLASCNQESDSLRNVYATFCI